MLYDEEQKKQREEDKAKFIHGCGLVCVFLMLFIRWIEGSISVDRIIEIVTGVGLVGFLIYRFRKWMKIRANWPVFYCFYY